MSRNYPQCWPIIRPSTLEDASEARDGFYHFLAGSKITGERV